MTINAIQKKDNYSIQLPFFEGPLDLLLYLIKREEVNIYDIPIAKITEQYLQTIELMKELDLEIAGEFILMAATLIQIKVRMLLPKEDNVLEEDEEDPRAELVRKLLDYKRFKEVAESLTSIEERQRRLYPHINFKWTKSYLQVQEVSNEELLKDISLFELFKAFKTALDNIPKVTTHEVHSINVTVEEQIDYLNKELQAKKRLPFSDIMENIQERLVIIVTFIAILELIKNRQIIVQQAESFGELWIIKK
ncbi:MAG: segregation/condensation protein A [bacterium]